ncbi:RHS repeat-associated core domain-containing protein [Echinimonas agarilytica]|uniref:RHS repeat-associated core domain-containing protein n=1 Tax=Echinimonas agarilytica TaxID=1215918 RepID=A0AA41W6U1_9GAMM|nr:RHS repeat-associated core domain-containing protein [Echinimonas agarilytica]MCM2680030.1 RHS repeat-associated core domain-containing protein [Echinimonas agarilytica]
MNGRIYDPTIGRFLQADPFIQAPKNSQSFNRYSYVLNNPLSYTDPTGYFFSGLKNFVKKYWKPIVAAVAAVVTYGAASGWAAGWGLTTSVQIGTVSMHGIAVYGTSLSLGGYMAAGAISGAIAGAISSGTLKGTLRGAFSGAVFGGLGYGQHVGGWSNPTQYAAHAMAGGVLNDLQGGKFGHGFITAGIMKAAGKFNTQGTISRTIVQAIAGGTVSSITGGKFKNGALTSAMQYVANEASSRFQHPDSKLAQILGDMSDELKSTWNSLKNALSIGTPEAAVAGSGAVSGHVLIAGGSYEKGIATDLSGKVCSVDTICGRLGPGYGSSVSIVPAFSGGSNLVEGSSWQFGYYVDGPGAKYSFLSDFQSIAVGKPIIDVYDTSVGAGGQACYVTVSNCSE